MLSYLHKALVVYIIFSQHVISTSASFELFSTKFSYLAETKFCVCHSSLTLTIFAEVRLPEKLCP